MPLLYRPILLAAALTYVLWGHSGSTASEARLFHNAEIDRELLLELVNAQRTEGAYCGGSFYPPVEALGWNSKLEEAALIHSRDMHKHGQFGHQGSDGSLLRNRVDSVGYLWRSIGENIAMGHGHNEHTVIRGWMDSSGHCANIMRKGFSEMGIARSGPYWTQVLAAPRP